MSTGSLVVAWLATKRTISARGKEKDRKGEERSALAARKRIEGYARTLMQGCGEREEREGKKERKTRKNVEGRENHEAETTAGASSRSCRQAGVTTAQFVHSACCSTAGRL